MNIKEIKDGIVIENTSHFDPEHTFLCGQCFRWDKEDDGSFTGIAYSKAVNIKRNEKSIIIKNITLEEYESTWKDYFDFETDYDKIKQLVSVDNHVKTAIDFGWGIHILNQEIFECLISFIISTQNQIPRIKKIVSALSEMYGSKIEYNSKTYYSFPTLEQLKGISAKELEPLKAGYRSEYIVNCVNKLSSGEVKLENIKKAPYNEAKKELMKIKGVGPKVADCVLLFSAGKKESFPIDVWVRRTVQTLYLNEKASVKEIETFANSYFGKYAGVAQQYLFYYSRENNLGK